MNLIKTAQYTKTERKFFKKHPELLNKYASVLKRLKINPFISTLKTHQLKGDLNKYHACSLTYSYRIVLIIKIVDDELILINIGSHNEVY